MEYWIYSTIIPIVIIAILSVAYRPLNISSISKILRISAILFPIYMLVIYFLEMENYINSGWAFYTLMFFFVPYLLIAIVVNVVTWKREKKS